ncbi:MAG: HAMP domain-containing sensor histidine kinase [Pseudomonadota bacterium]
MSQKLTDTALQEFRLRRMFITFTLSSVILFLVMTLLFLVPRINSTFDNLRNISDRTTTEAYLAQLDGYLTDRKLALQDVAKNPLLINSLLIDDSSNPALKDFIQHTYLLGEDPVISLLDFSGRELWSEYRTDRNYDWVLPMINSRAEFSLRMLIDGSQPKFELAVPILYGRGHEGVLLAQILAQPSKIYEPATELDPRSHYVTLVRNGVQAQSPVGEMIAPHTETSHSQKYDIDVSLTTEHVEVAAQKNDLIRGFAYSLLLGAVFVFGGLVLIGRRLIIQPYTLLAQTKRMLEQANDELAQFAYRASHDLKAPLITSRGLVEYAEEDIKLGSLDEASGNCAKAIARLKDLESLVTDILSLARADLATNTPEEVDFEEIANETRLRFADMSTQKRCIITTDVRLTRPYFGERVRFVQVIDNLLSNSIKYANTDREQPHVSLCVLEQEDMLELEVSDNALGIPSNRQADVFQMFKRFHPSVESGSGLGLSIVSKHVKAMNGTIDFASTEAGTTFKISIPHVQA